MKLQHMPTDAFEQVYRLMEESFPADEIRTYEGQKALLSDPRYQIYVPEGNIRAMMAVWHLDGFTFLEHFAVGAESRNGGVGSAMLQALKERMQTDICLEAELPETEITCRRIGFYQRNGFYFHDYPYLQPALSPGRKPVALALMTTGRPRAEAELSDLKALLYRDVYGLKKEK